ncbi:MAG: formylmethanofuran dehydrogenase subunit E family protein [Candidatus Omnitrophica bacterium]|nr:formylmethanofuran dehydrogenase subunit E family protein [Candidatus Omnitrophota bacterium]
MKKEKLTLQEAVEFHGHLGPYLVLGILAGEVALKKLKFKKHFGIDVKVWGASKKPKSCLIDGLQLSTGATYGKGNIEKLDGPLVKIRFRNRLNQKEMILTLREDLIKRLKEANTHKDCEDLAREIYSKMGQELFFTSTSFRKNNS